VCQTDSIKLRDQTGIQELDQTKPVCN